MSLCLVSPRGLQHSPRSRPNPNPHFFGLSHPLCTLPPVLSAAYGLLALLALVAPPSLPLCLPCPLPAPSVLHPRRPRRSPPLARGRDAAIHSAALPLRQEPPRFLGRAVTVQLGLLQLEPQGPFVADDVRNVLVGLGVPVQLQDWLGLCSSLRAGACVPTGSESYLAALGALIPPLSCLHSFSCFLFRNLQCISAAVQPSWVSIDLPSRAGRGVTTSGCLGMGWSRWSLGRSGSPVGQADTSL